MKKLLSLVLVLAMLLGCTAMAEAVDYTGVWALTGAEFAGVQMGPNMLAGMGLDMRMELAADGNVTLTTNGEVETGTWAATANGVAITDEFETLEFVYQDEMLLMEQQGAVLMLTREGAAPAIDDAAQSNVVLAGVDPLAFEGAWLLTNASAMGIDFTAEDLGVYIAFVLVGGEGVYGESNAEGGIDQYPITYAVTEVEGEGTLLELIYNGEDVEGPVVMMALNLLEDGRLYLQLVQEGLTIDYYFTRQVEEAAE